MTSIVDPRPVYIYALVDPRTDEVRYIGQSLRPYTRWRAHINRAKKTSTRHSSAWIRGLLSEGLEPALRILETADLDNWVDAERRQIEAHRAAGCQLTNLSVGGEGAPGVKQRPETVAKRAAAIKGFRHSPETLERMRQVQQNRTWNPNVLTPEGRARLCASLHARTLTAEQRAEMSRRQTGKTFSAEHIANLKKARQGRVYTPETLAKKSAGMSTYWRDNPKAVEHRAKINAAMARRRLERAAEANASSVVEAVAQTG